MEFRNPHPASRGLSMHSYPDTWAVVVPLVNEEAKLPAFV